MIPARDAGIELIDHAADVAIFCSRVKDAEAAGGVAPVEVFDGDAADAPGVHGVFGGAIEVDGIGACEGPPVVIDLEDFASFYDAKDGACGPAGPIGGGAMDGAREESAAEGIMIRIGGVIAFGVSVCGGADGLELGTSDGRLVFGEWSRGGAGGEENDEGKKEEERRQPLGGGE